MWLCVSVSFRLFVRKKILYDVARLLLMVPLEPWRNSSPIFGVAALCTTKIDGFRASVTSTSMGGGTAFRRAYLARAYTTLVVLVRPVSGLQSSSTNILSLGEMNSCSSFIISSSSSSPCVLVRNEIILRTSSSLFPQ